jgi:hypothetical protein
MKFFSFFRVVSSSLLFTAATMHAEESVSLAGQWRFALDDAKKGIAAKWYAGELKPSADEPAQIALPGSTDEAKAGHPNKQKPDYSGLYRPHVYTGPAWYQREIEIPDGWQGKHVTLFLERNHWTNHVWLDDRDCGAQDSLIAPQLFDLGHVAPGKHRLTICVDNTLKYDLGPFPSINYEGTQTNWNGIVGAIELRGADPIALTHLEIYPDLAGKKIKVVATVANRTSAAANGQLQLSVADANGKAQGSPATAAYSSSETESTVTAEVPMGDDFKTWDEFAPNLYTLKVVLAADPSRSEQSAVFGMRQLTIQGTQFAMNGRPLMLRGTLECAIFPLTAYPSMDVPAWRRIFQIEKSYGLNFMRCHSWCPPEAAFAAADLEGVMLQVEGPNANIYYGNQPREAFIEKELLRMVHTYGNHPSFCLMTLGNECEFATPELGKIPAHWLDLLIQADSRHFYASASGGKPVANRQWTERGSGGVTDSTEHNLIGILNEEGGPNPGPHASPFAIYPNSPIVDHEPGQWAVYPNLDEIKKYTGVLEPRNFALVRDDLQAKGMLDQAPRFFEASGRLAGLLYKATVEENLRTPGLGGFSLLDLHDYPGQGTALIGILDPFWDSKGIVTPEEFHRHTGAVVPLLLFPKRCYATNEHFKAQAELSQFGPADLAGIHPRWKIEDDGGNEIASGALPPIDAPTGKLAELGAIDAPLAQAKHPGKYTITLSIDGTAYSNHWDVWIYPPVGQVATPAGVAVAQTWEEARAALAAGKKVVFFPKRLDPAQSRGGAFRPVYWSPVWIKSNPGTMGILLDPKHPLFAQFPTEFFGDWQWYNLLEKSRTMILNETPKDYHPLVQVIDNFARNDRLGSVFETALGQGQLLVCTLPVFGSALPESAQFLRSLYAYVDSPAFQPKAALDLDTLDKLFTIVPSHLQALGVTVLKADSELPNYPPSAAIDGDPASFWHANTTPLPHYLILDLGKSMTVKGLTYLGRQDSANGRIKQFRIYLGNDPKAFGKPVAEGEFANVTTLQICVFPHPASGRYLKLEALSEVSGQPFTTAAEVDLQFEAP